MSSLGSPSPFFLAGKKAYEIERSLRFNRSDSAYLTKSLGSTSNRRTFTYSFWVKRTVQNQEQCLIYNGHPSSTPYGEIRFEYQSGNIHELNFYSYDGSHQFQIRTNRKFRDSSAWYHIVLALDTTQSTQSDRVKIYVNGQQETTFTTANYPSQNVDTAYNVSGNTHSIGGFRNTSNSFDGYVAEFNFIDGQQLTPSYFAETDAITGQWNPKKYTGSYGTNGFYLNFSDNSGTTATTLGKDSSGNGNNFTPNNFSVAAGTGNDSLEDTPTNNFATLNALKKPTNGAISNGNLDGSGNASAWVSFFSTILVSSGKWFCEVKVNATRVGVGIAKDGADENSYLGSAADTYAYFDLNGKWNNNSDSAYGATYTTNDIIGMALDMDAGTLIFYKNGASQGTAFTGLSGEFALGFTVYGGSASASINYGQRAFDYTVPTGYKTLCSANLPDPTILLPNKHFGTILYTGDNTDDRNITDSSAINFTPDWVWHKARNAANYHFLFDSIRGATKFLVSNSTGAESTQADSLSAFITNGFTVSDNTANADMNSSSHTYAAWNWNGGGSTVTNNDGSISSQVRANTTAGFSIATYTGTGSSTTVGHGLGVKPDAIIIKRRDGGSGGTNWRVYHHKLNGGSNPEQYHLILNASNAESGQSNIFNDTAPTSSVFTVGTHVSVNGSSGTHVAYCFSEVAGYSKFGSYTGNGSSDGTFVYTGFKPAFILTKSTTSTHWWEMADNTRTEFNPRDKTLYSNRSDAEYSGSQYYKDFLSNGFKARSDNGGHNGSGNTYIYLAFAESPFKNARAR